MIPLSYVIRADVTCDVTCPTLKTDEPFSAEWGSIEMDLIVRASHAHPLYPQCCEAVYFKLEEACRATKYADSLKPFSRKKDGRGAFFALKAQYAGKDKWEAELKRCASLLLSRKWKGNSSHSLDLFISQHRAAFVSMQACSLHVDYQLPNAHSRVGYLLDGIECDDAALQAAIAVVEEDDDPLGKRNDFEAAATHILPKDPVAKRRILAA
jgi:hypothetical protein